MEKSAWLTKSLGYCLLNDNNSPALQLIKAFRETFPECQTIDWNAQHSHSEDPLILPPVDSTPTRLKSAGEDHAGPLTDNRVFYTSVSDDDTLLSLDSPQTVPETDTLQSSFSNILLRETPCRDPYLWSLENINLGVPEMMKDEFDISSTCAFEGFQHPAMDSNDSTDCPSEKESSDVQSTKTKKTTKERKRHMKKRTKPNECTHLYAFFKELVKNPPEENLIEQTSEDPEEFRIINSERVASLWGQMKPNRKKPMTYEKLARSLRYYNKQGIMYKIDNKRLHFGFGNTSVWKKM